MFDRYTNGGNSKTRNLMVRHEAAGAKLAPDVGVEPTLSVLETDVLP
jgi:hypothetical protein